MSIDPTADRDVGLGSGNDAAVARDARTDATTTDAADTGCAPGYARAPSGCVDIDECSSECLSPATCRNLPGTFECACSLPSRVCNDVCRRCPSAGVAGTRCESQECVVDSCRNGFQRSSSGLACVSTTAAAWREVTAPTNPGPRWYHSMVFDGRQLLLVSGADNDNRHIQDTWTFDGTAWTRVATNGPAGRGGHAMAYDSARQRVVLFGGDNGAPLADTWEWNGSEWQQRAIGSGPGRRSGHAMAYDSVRQRTVLFGGSANTTDLGDTWEWDGSTWTQIRPATAPVARWGHVMVFDSVRARTVLFAGTAGLPRNDTWEWDGSRWMEVATASSPPRRYRGVMVFSAAAGVAWLLGGTPDTTPIRDMWQYDGTNWTSLHAWGELPPGRAFLGGAYDQSREAFVVFGGWDGFARTNFLDTWSYPN